MIVVKLVNAPSQAHLQGTQYTKANIAKEPVFLVRFRHTPCHGGHILLIQSTMMKGEYTTSRTTAALPPKKNSPLA